MTDEQGLIKRYVEELYRWNKKVNLTSVPERDAGDVLITPSFGVGELFPAGKTLRVFDIGSGGGVPAIPLAIRFPQHRFFLVESDRKKSVFLAHVAGLLDLKNVSVLNERSEKVAMAPDYANSADAVASRAVKRDVVFKAAAGLLKPGGRVILHRSPESSFPQPGYRPAGRSPSADAFERE